MRKLILCCFAVSICGLALGEERAMPAASPEPTPSPTPAVSSGDSAMVRAAKSRAATPKSKDRIKLTNEDVRKSSGKLMIVSGKPLPAATPATVPEEKLKPGEKEQREFAEARATAQKRNDDAQKRVERLERALNAAEEAYYDAEDPSDRDTIERRFAQAKEDLDKARADVQKTGEELARHE
jgi:hypothetical protein